MNKLFFLAGVGVGYVLGAKAGKERYEEIKEKAHEFVEHPTVQSTAHRVNEGAVKGVEVSKAKAQDVAVAAKQKIEDKRSDDTDFTSTSSPQPLDVEPRPLP